MSTLEYEVLFVFGSVNVTALAYVDEGDFSEDETLEQVAIRRAGETVALEIGLDCSNADEVTVKHTGTIR